MSETIKTGIGRDDMEKIINDMKSLQVSGDLEYSHYEADKLLTLTLRLLGLHEIVVEYEKIDKWYA